MSKQNTRPPFHLAFPVRDLSEARNFYGELLGCPEGRSSDQWIDFDFYGHQIVTHLAPEECGSTGTSSVDAHNVPVRHFGAVLEMRSEEHTSELQSLMRISYAVFCLKKKNNTTQSTT